LFHVGHGRTLAGLTSVNECIGNDSLLRAQNAMSGGTLRCRLHTEWQCDGKTLARSPAYVPVTCCKCKWPTQRPRLWRV